MTARLERKAHGQSTSRWAGATDVLRYAVLGVKWLGCASRRVLRLPYSRVKGLKFADEDIRIVQFSLNSSPCLPMLCTCLSSEKLLFRTSLPCHLVSRAPSAIPCRRGSENLRAWTHQKSQRPYATLELLAETSVPPSSPPPEK